MPKNSTLEAPQINLRGFVLCFFDRITSPVPEFVSMWQLSNNSVYEPKQLSWANSVQYVTGEN